ncbi:ras-related protein Rab-32 [Polymixia lowei]
MAEGPVSFSADKLFKVLVIGDLGVGKSSIILRYVNKRFIETYKASIGVDFSLKTIEWDTKTLVRLQLWDIAGQEQFRKMSRVYYREAMGALVVFDVTKWPTLESASQWKQDLDSKVRLDNGSPIPAVLLANKCDVTEGKRDLASSLDHFCKDNSFLGWFETSAKDNINIDEASTFLIKHMIQCDKGPSDGEYHRDVVKITLAPGATQSQSLCCWRPRF